MSFYSVDENCVRCGLCSQLCPAEIIETAVDGVPFVAPTNEAHCIRCGQCVSYCPTRACSLEFQPSSERVPVDAKLMPTPEACETFLRSRRSVRRFAQEPLPREVVLRILETARYAPTASNRQLVRWVVSETRERTREIAQKVIDTFKARLSRRDPGDSFAPYLVEVLKKWDAGHEIIFRGAPNLAIALMPADNDFHVDAAIALTYLELAAYANGVGCCWGGFFTIAARENPALREFVGARPDEAIVGAQMMGTPALGASRLLPPRKRVDVSWI